MRGKGKGLYREELKYRLFYIISYEAVIIISDLFKIFEENRVVNWHEHVWFDKEQNLDRGLLGKLVDVAKKTHTDLLVCSNPVLPNHCPPELFRRCNDVQAEAMALYPDFIKGMCFVNPGYIDEALDEIDRCVGTMGFIGVKLYNQYLISDPILYKLIRKCAELDVPILEHACKLNFYQESQPFASTGTHFAKVAAAHPDVTFIHAHISGGGDWQWALKEIAPFPNVFIDMSGSVCDENIIEESVRYLGADRILFGTDMSYSACVGKIIAADIYYEDKVKILNNPHFARYLERGA